MIVSSPWLEEVRHLRVTETSPPTSTDDNLDYLRCSALHNAIIKHGWTASGRDIDELPKTFAWPSEPGPNEERLHPDVAELLKRCIDRDTGGVFYFTNFVATGDHLWRWTEGEDEDFLTLYMANEFTDTPSFVTYDQYTHLCRMNDATKSHIETPETWQRLEVMLSAWIDLIERGKMVALDYATFDPTTGAQRTEFMSGPWTVLPYAKQDLIDTLSTWDALVEAINARMPNPAAEPFTDEPIFSPDQLRAATICEKSFYWKFSTVAKRPRFEYLGPGLRLATANDIASHPFTEALNADQAGWPRCDFPVPLLLGDSLAQDWVQHRAMSAEQVRWGLYTQREAPPQDNLTPVEDASVLALPYTIGDNGFALRADGTRIIEERLRPNAELYQIGQNPFTPCHDTQLYAILGAFLRHVESELWSIGKDGVKESEHVFKDADTEEGMHSYVVPLPHSSNGHL